MAGRKNNYNIEDLIAVLTEPEIKSKLSAFQGAPPVTNPLYCEISDKVNSVCLKNKCTAAAVYTRLQKNKDNIINKVNYANWSKKKPFEVKLVKSIIVPKKTWEEIELFRSNQKKRNNNLELDNFLNEKLLKCFQFSCIFEINNDVEDVEIFGYALCMECNKKIKIIKKIEDELNFKLKFEVIKNGKTLVHFKRNKINGNMRKKYKEDLLKNEPYEYQTGLILKSALKNGKYNK